MREEARARSSPPARRWGSPVSGTRSAARPRARKKREKAADPGDAGHGNGEGVGLIGTAGDIRGRRLRPRRHAHRQRTQLPRGRRAVPALEGHRALRRGVGEIVGMGGAPFVDFLRERHGLEGTTPTLIAEKDDLYLEYARGRTKAFPTISVELVRYCHVHGYRSRGGTVVAPPRARPRAREARLARYFTASVAGDEVPHQAASGYLPRGARRLGREPDRVPRDRGLAVRGRGRRRAGMRSVAVPAASTSGRKWFDSRAELVFPGGPPNVDVAAVVELPGCPWPAARRARDRCRFGRADRRAVSVGRVGFTTPARIGHAVARDRRRVPHPGFRVHAPADAGRPGAAEVPGVRRALSHGVADLADGVAAGGADSVAGARVQPARTRSPRSGARDRRALWRAGAVRRGRSPLASRRGTVHRLCGRRVRLRHAGDVYSRRISGVC